MYTYRLYTITHLSTQKTHLGITVQDTTTLANELLRQLRTQRHSNSSLQDLYDLDDNVDIQFSEPVSAAEAKRRWITRAKELHEKGLLLNYRTSAVTLKVKDRPKRDIRSAARYRKL